MQVVLKNTSFYAKKEGIRPLKKPIDRPKKHRRRAPPTKKRTKRPPKGHRTPGGRLVFHVYSVPVFSYKARYMRFLSVLDRIPEVTHRVHKRLQILLQRLRRVRKMLQSVLGVLHRTLKALHGILKTVHGLSQCRDGVL